MESSGNRCVFKPSRLMNETDQTEIGKEWVNKKKDPDCFDVKPVNRTVGKGLFAKKSFRSGDFLIEYQGELISDEDAVRREKRYQASLGSFLFFFRHKGKRLCVDATYSNTKGKYMNDAVGVKKNAEMRKINVSDIPHLCVFASKNIKTGEEIRYDYGVPNLPWRMSKTDSQSNTVIKKRKTPYSRSGKHIAAGKKGNSQIPLFGHGKYANIKACSVALERCPSEECMSTQTMQEKDAIKTAPYIHTEVDNISIDTNAVTRTALKSAIGTTHCQESHSLKQNANDKGLKDFLKAFTSDSVAEGALKKQYFIEEENVETAPDTVQGYNLQAINDDLLSSARQYFTEDAWMCLNNTLKVIKAKSSTTEIGPCTYDNIPEKFDHKKDSSEHFKFATQTMQEKDAIKTAPYIHTEVVNISIDTNTVTSTALKSPIGITHCKENHNLKPNANDKGLKDFLKAFTSDSVAEGALKKQYFIEEENVETAPETVQGYNLQAINDDLLSSARQYFTEDAWMCLNNTLKVIKAKSRTTEIGPCTYDNIPEKFDHKIDSCKHSKFETTTSNGEQGTSMNKSGISLKDFLYAFASGYLVELAIKNHYIIEKEDLETAPDNIPSDIYKHIDDVVLSSAEKYFTPDAWICIQDMFEAIKVKEYDADTWNSIPNTISYKEDGTSHYEAERGEIKTNQEKYKKPYRPCPFCKKLMSKLRNHLETKHKQEPEVKTALLLPKKERNNAFDNLRKKGILKFNLNVMKHKNPTSMKMQRERKPGKDDSRLIYCSKCLAFVSRRLFYRHKRTCYMADNSTAVPHKIPSSIMFNPEETARFEREVLCSFNNDDVGVLCTSDPLIIAYGKREYNRIIIQSDKQDEKRKTLKSDMRRLGRLYISFREQCREEKTSSDSAIDLFNRRNFKILESSITKISTGDDGVIKDGFKIGIGYLLKKVAKYIYGSFLEAKEDNKAEEITKFLDLLNFHWLNIFSPSEYLVKKARQSVLRKPANLPLTQDVQLLRDYTVKEITKHSGDDFKFISQTDFILLRDLLVCRLTLFNARRGGEPSRLTIAEWEDAENNVWHHHINSEEIKDPLDKKLLERYKLAYQPGKTGKLVPLLIIDDCWKGLRILVDPEVRIRIGVSKQNVFVFPYTQLSNSHVLGWHAVNRCCELAGCSKKINATNRRHQVATLYAAHEVSPDERAGFLLHMDHSENVNLNVYQSPPAMNEITKVGKVFLQLDSIGHLRNSEVKEKEATIDTGDSQQDTSNGSHKDRNDSTTTRKTRHVLVKHKHLEKNLSTIDSHTSSGNKETSNRTPYKRTRHTNTIEKTVKEDLTNSDDYEESGDEYHPSGSSKSSSDDNSEQDHEPVTCTQHTIRPYNRWSDSQTHLIRNYFNEFIFSTDNVESNKGHLPGKREVTTFLQMNPDILRGEDDRIRVQRLKTKIFNERKTVRKQLIATLNT